MYSNIRSDDTLVCFIVHVYCIVAFIRWGFNLAIFAININTAKLNTK